MNTLICRTCGCSLVRLGISKQDAPAYRHAGEEHRFCCQGCVDLFVIDPDKHLQETSDVIVCPTCLGEKPTKWAVRLNVGGRDVYFCRCPYCVELFKKNPDFYIGRLQGAIENRACSIMRVVAFDRTRTDKLTSSAAVSLQIRGPEV